MSSAPLPSVKIPEENLDILTSPVPDKRPNILAPKHGSPPRANVTAESQEVKSLLTSVNKSHDVPSIMSSVDNVETTRASTNSRMGVPTLVHVLSQVFSNVIKDLQDMPEPSSIPTSDAGTVQSSDSPSWQNGTNDPVVSNPSNIPTARALGVQALANRASIDIKAKCSQPSIHQVAQGPPTNLSIEQSLNFASRKSFHSDTTPFVASTAVCQPLPQSTSAHITKNTTRSCLDALPARRSQANLSSTRNRSNSDTSVSSTSSDTHLQDVQSFLAPKPFSPKPMISFDISKWTKEMKDVTLDDESYDSLMSWYDFIQTGMVIATNTKNVMPELKDLSKSFDFSYHILPHSNSSVYKAGHMEYVSMAKALRIHILKPSNIAKSCSQVIAKRNRHKNERDGFVLLMHLLGGVFPHLGGPHVDVVSAISSMTARKTETFESLLQRFVNLGHKLELAGHQVPPTALFQRYLDLIKTNHHIFSMISPIHRRFYAHIKMHGPDVPFTRYTISDVHEYLKDSGIDTETIIMQHNNFSQKRKTNAQAHHAQDIIVPQANAAVANTSTDVHGPRYEDEFPQCEQQPQANAASMAIVPHKKPTNGRWNSPCPVCYQRHPPLRCWIRGPDFQPLWLQRNAAKYNALHKSDKDKVDPKYKSQPPPLRHSQVSAQANKSVSFSPHNAIVDTIYPTSDNVSTTLPPQDVQKTQSWSSQMSEPEYNQSISDPICNMAKDDLPVSKNDDMSFIEA